MLAESWKPSAGLQVLHDRDAPRRGLHDGKPMTVDDIVSASASFGPNMPSLLLFMTSPESRRPTMRPSSSALQADAGALFRRHHHGAILYIVPKHVYAGGDIMTNSGQQRAIAGP